GRSPASADLAGRVPPPRRPAGSPCDRARGAIVDALRGGRGLRRPRGQPELGCGGVRSAATVTAGPVFLDSGIVIAFLDGSDRHHAAALRLFADPPRRWSTSLAVVSETHGWFLHQLGEDAARIFRLVLTELPRLQLLPLTLEHHAAVLSKLERLRGHDLALE